MLDTIIQYMNVINISGTTTINVNKSGIHYELNTEVKTNDVFLDNNPIYEIVIWNSTTFAAKKWSLLANCPVIKNVTHILYGTSEFYRVADAYVNGGGSSVYNDTLFAYNSNNYKFYCYGFNFSVNIGYIFIRYAKSS